MDISQYIEKISTRYRLGNATEHTFRGDLQNLIESLVPGVAATNEPKRIECGAPDYVITRRNIPVGYIEAKDIENLDAKNNKEQFDRYRDALDNLILTDYLDYRFYVDGEPAAAVKIGEIRGGKVVPLPENFDKFKSLLTEFCSRTPQTIKSSKKLAEMMAEKAKILAFIIKKALEDDVAANVRTDLTDQMKAFKTILIHDIDESSFADIYAQTIAYGMFAARLHDTSLATFTRREAAELIPKTNPFLRKLFQYIAGFDLDTRIDWIVDALADLFRAADIAAILKNFGRSTQTHDPIMHFYETFLSEYDPKLRKSRGVFYTPEPVVDFIVRAVDDILKTEFNLPQGLADTSKTKIKLRSTVKDDRTRSGYREEEKEVHKVQILDPATGTGTFLAQVIKQIHKSFEDQQGVWNRYVDEHLIPRLNGFELLMASYAMAHLKLDLLLSELSETAMPPNERKGSASGTEAEPQDLSGNLTEGHSPSAHHTGNAGSERSQRFQIYLTNALEEYHPETGTLFATWLSDEANEANHIKRDTPVMVVIGNPPYAVSSSNKGKWITDLLDIYKKNVGEINKNALSDDYVKFIRFGQHLIEKNSEGILAYISNNSFLDGITHRQMRKNLLQVFDKIFICNLHGDSKKGEKAPDGAKDENVFDIQQGVSVSIFIKTSQKINDGKVFYQDIYGSRDHKYQSLETSSLESTNWKELLPDSRYAFFTPKDFSAQQSFDDLLPLDELFSTVGGGIKFRKDNLLVKNNFSRNDVIQMLSDVNNLTDSKLKEHYNFEETKDWKIAEKRKYFIQDDVANIRSVTYRPFDIRYTYYPYDSINEIITRGDSRRGFMKNAKAENTFLVLTKGNRQLSLGYFWISSGLFDLHLLDSAADSLQSFPLYLYPDESRQADGQAALPLDVRKSSAFPSDGTHEEGGSAARRVPNLNMEIVEKIAAELGLTFVSEPGAIATGLPDSAATNPVTSPTTAPDKSGGSTLTPEEPALRSFAPIDLLDYIYAVLHSPSYREKYKEFLKIDFPRVPYPKDAKTFWRLVELGGELRQIHLLESPKVDDLITGFPVGGNNIVEKPVFVNKDGENLERTTPSGKPGHPSFTKEGSFGNVYINAEQYFSGVPKAAWEFYIGGYQPAQKWLKDRKGRELSYEDIRHYQKIIVALTETGRLMKEIEAWF